MLLLVTTIFLIFYAVLIGYYFYHWKQLKMYLVPAKPPSVFVSIIVAARNEEQCIGRLLEALLQQTYPKELFEIIIVDDFSTDATANVVRSFSTNQIKLIHQYRLLKLGQDLNWKSQHLKHFQSYSTLYLK